MKPAFPILTGLGLIWVIGLIGYGLMVLPSPESYRLALAMVPLAVLLILMKARNNILSRSLDGADRRLKASFTLLLVEPAEWWQRHSWLYKFTLMGITTVFLMAAGAAIYSLVVSAETVRISQVLEEQEKLSEEVSELKKMLAENLDRDESELAAEVAGLLNWLETEPTPTPKGNVAGSNETSERLPSPTPDNKTATMAITDQAVPVYEKPQYDARQIGLTLAGEAYEITAYSQNFLRLKLDDYLSGWVRRYEVTEL